MSYYFNEKKRKRVFSFMVWGSLFPKIAFEHFFFVFLIKSSDGTKQPEARGMMKEERFLLICFYLNLFYIYISFILGFLPGSFLSV